MILTGKKCNNQAYSCPRYWRFSPVMGPNLGFYETPCISKHYGIERFKGVTKLGSHAERRQSLTDYVHFSSLNFLSNIRHCNFFFLDIKSTLFSSSVVFKGDIFWLHGAPPQPPPPLPLPLPIESSLPSPNQLRTLPPLKLLDNMLP